MKKKVWTKPVCERVKLVPAEACFMSCKHPGGHHRRHSRCGIVGIRHSGS